MYNKSLAATTELSLASPLFLELGPDGRELLGVVAFFPQGVDKNNFEWLFPTISGVSSILDKFHFYAEGIRQAEEALEICGRLGDPPGQLEGWHLTSLGFLL